MGYPLTAFDLRNICKTMLDRKGLNVTKFSGNIPGEDWAKSVLKRHSTTLSERFLVHLLVMKQLSLTSQI